MSLAAPWMITALRELDVAETPGPGNTPRVLAYHAATSLRATQDAVPWCAAYVGWTLRETGITPTGSALARSYEPWGIDSPVEYGAVAVLSRGTPPSGHVGFIVDADDTTVWLLSGNVSNRVCIRPFPLTRLVACRWPGHGGP